jgi:hypothetical protein
MVAHSHGGLSVQLAVLDHLSTHLDIGLVNDAVKVLHASTVVQLVQNNNLQVKHTQSQKVVRPSCWAHICLQAVGPLLTDTCC